MPEVAALHTWNGDRPFPDPGRVSHPHIHPVLWPSVPEMAGQICVPPPFAVRQWGLNSDSAFLGQLYLVNEDISTYLIGLL